MSKEQEMNELIESLNQGEKDKAWAQLQNEIKRMETGGELPVCDAFPKPRVSVKKITSICASLALVISVGTVAAFHFFGREEDSEKRFGANDPSDFVQESEYTLKEYAQQGKNFLYFDWYDQMDDSYYLPTGLYVSPSGEIDCYYERYVQPETVTSISLFIVDREKREDVFDKYPALRVYRSAFSWYQTTVDGTTVYYAMDIGGRSGDAVFEYGEYCYCLYAYNLLSDTHIIELAAELLP